MAMDTTAPPAVDKAGNPGGPPAPRAARPWWLGPNLLLAFVGAAAGYALGHMVGNWIAHTYQQVQGEGDNSSERIAMANNPATKKYTSIATRYCTPTTLWSRV